MERRSPSLKQRGRTVNQFIFRLVVYGLGKYVVSPLVVPRQETNHSWNYPPPKSKILVPLPRDREVKLRITLIYRELVERINTFTTIGLLIAIVL